MTTYYRPSRDKRGCLVASVLTPDASQPIQINEDFGNSLSAGNGIVAMKTYMQEHYGEVEMASPSQWQRELESRQFHSSEMIASLELLSRFHGIDVKEYIVYGARSRPLHTSWVSIPDALYIQQSDKDQRTSGYYTYVAVPEALDKATIERYELSFVSRPQPVQEQ